MGFIESARWISSKS
jgi:esterase/lipase superfamily enzyme